MCVNISRLHCTDHQHIFAFNRIQSNTFGFQSVCLFVSSTFFIFIAIVWFAAPPTHRKPTTLFSSVIFLASHYFSFHSTQFLLTAHTHTLSWTPYTLLMSLLCCLFKFFVVGITAIQTHLKLLCVTRRMFAPLPLISVAIFIFFHFHLFYFISLNFILFFLLCLCFFLIVAHFVLRLVFFVFRFVAKKMCLYLLLLPLIAFLYYLISICSH